MGKQQCIQYSRHRLNGVGGRRTRQAMTSGLALGRFVKN